MNNDLQKINPLKVEVAKLVDNIKNTIISMPEGKTGLELMKDNKKILQKKRTDVVLILKNERSSAVDYQRQVINMKKEILRLIEPVETELGSKIAQIELEEAREKRLELLPERQEKLREVGCSLPDEELLDMDDKTFATLYLDKKSEYLAEQERRIEAKRITDEEERQRKEDELAEKQRKLDEDKRVEAARKQAAKEAAEQAVRDAEVAKVRADEARLKAIRDAEERAEQEKQEILMKANREKQDLIDKQAAEEAARVKAEEESAAAKIKKDQEEKDAQEKLEKVRRYKKFLKDNGWTEETKDQFLVDNQNGIVSLYKKLGEFKV